MRVLFRKTSLPVRFLDKVVERARGIADEENKIMTLVRLATLVLLPDREVPPPQFLTGGVPFPENPGSGL